MAIPIKSKATTQTIEPKRFRGLPRGVLEFHLQGNKGCEDFRSASKVAFKLTPTEQSKYPEFDSAEWLWLIYEVPEDSGGDF